MNSSSDLKPHLDHNHALDLLGGMMRIRRFEQKCAELYTQQKIRGFLHLYDGEEAVAMGVIPVLGKSDRIIATYREHGHALARGVSMQSILAEMYGKREGCAGGRGGSMHLFSRDENFYGGNAIVGGGLPLAVGLALADKMQDNDAISTCFFGEGAVAEGEFHESMNLAALWQLPVLFVCENNGYATSYAVQSESVDGMDVIAVEAAARRAIQHIKKTGQPYLLECKTYRFRPHSMFDAQLYRSKQEVEEWREKGPIFRFRDWLIEMNMINQNDVDTLVSTIDNEVEEAVAFAEAGSPESLESLTRHVVSETRPPPPVIPEPSSETVNTTYREAIRAGIVDAMLRDERVFLMGEDVGHYGGCYAVSKGLLDEFGAERIRDTPLCESGFTGAGIGAAVAGMRPIVEVMTVNFSLLALDQIMNTAATLRHMSNNQFGVPVVIRMATGAGKQLAAQHSHSLEGWYAHIPGIRVLTPATLEDARGMLWTALQDPDPVLIFENVMLYNNTGELAGNAGPVDIDNACVRKQGTDLSLITYGGSLYKSLDAAAELEKKGISCEVIDLRSLRPLDMKRIEQSVRKTHRALVVDESWCSGSLAAEIGMRLAENSLFELDASLARVCSAEVPIPYAPHLEAAAIPQVDTIVAASLKLMNRVQQNV